MQIKIKKLKKGKKKNNWFLLKRKSFKNYSEWLENRKEIWEEAAERSPFWAKFIHDVRPIIEKSIIQAKKEKKSDRAAGTGSPRGSTAAHLSSTTIGTRDGRTAFPRSSPRQKAQKGHKISDFNDKISRLKGKGRALLARLRL